MNKTTDFFISDEELLKINNAEHTDPIFSKEYLIEEETPHDKHSSLSELMSEHDIDENILNKISAYIDQQISKSIQEVFVNHQTPNAQEIHHGHILNILENAAPDDSDKEENL